MKRIIFSVRDFFAEMGLLGGIFCIILFILLLPFTLLALLGELFCAFNEKSMEWFGGSCE